MPVRRSRPRTPGRGGRLGGEDAAEDAARMMTIIEQPGSGQQGREHPASSRGRPRGWGKAACTPPRRPAARVASVRKAMGNANSQDEGRTR